MAILLSASLGASVATACRTDVGRAFSASGMPLWDTVIRNGSMPLIDSKDSFVAEFDHKESEQQQYVMSMRARTTGVTDAAQ